jgi:hypothetical protein
MNLPEDIVGQIYSYLSLKTIYLLAGQNILNQKLIKNIIKNKYEEMNVKNTSGFASNFYHKCFKCNKNLKSSYNLIMCYFCSLKEKQFYISPLICHQCSEKKLNRGEHRFTMCNICGKPTSHLGITPFS